MTKNIACGEVAQREALSSLWSAWAVNKSHQDAAMKSARETQVSYVLASTGETRHMPSNGSPVDPSQITPKLR